ncbi:MAG: ABC transporter ATP-binding protein [Desulfobacterales bacterium]|nr:ABC transporter ATP-binding protein [Desulfobacterales bacterium]
MDSGPKAETTAPRGAAGAPAGLLAVRGLCKSYRSGATIVRVLQDLDFDLEAGETIAVIGASGIGKSTLLHVLGALDRPDAGRVLYKGESLFDWPDVQLARFRNESIGFVFQFHHLLPEFSALENTLMPALIHGWGRARAARAAREVLVRVGLQDRLDYRVGKLSGGEQQRVALARALVLRPPLLLADEPTGNLDRKNGEQVHRLLLELNRELGMALVVVTHNLELAACMSRRETLVDGRLERAA